MATLTAPRKSSKSKPADVFSLSLTINATAYDVTPIRGIQDPAIVRAFRLEKAGDPDAIYDVAIHAHGGTSCQCPDWETRHHDFNTAGCKHVRGLVAMGLIEPAKPVPNVVPVSEGNPTRIDWSRWESGTTCPEDAPALEPEPAACCAPEAEPCTACRTLEPAAVEPEALPATLPAEDPADDQGDDDGPSGDLWDGDPWDPDDRIGLGPDPEPIPAEWGKPDGPQTAREWGRLPKGPDPIDAAWWRGFGAGQAEGEAERGDLEMTISRLEALLADARAELAAAGQEGGGR